MFRVHIPIIKNIRRIVEACDFLKRDFGCVVVLRDAGYIVFTVCMFRATHGNMSTVNTNYAATLKTTKHKKPGAENHKLQVNI